MDWYSKGLHQPQHRLIAALGIDPGAALHDPAQTPFGQLLGRVLAGEHPIDQHTQ